MKMFRIPLIVLLGFVLTQCGKPTDPESVYPPTTGGYKVLSKFATHGFAQDIVKRDSLCYITQGEGGLLIVDVSDPLNPVEVAVLADDIRGYSAKVAIKDNAIYIATGSFGLTFVDVSDPLHPIVIASNQGVKPVKNLHVYGDYLFSAASEQGVQLVDVKKAVKPSLNDKFDVTGYSMGVATGFDSTYIFVATGEMGLSIHNVTFIVDGYGPVPEAGRCDIPGYAEAVAVAEGTNYAFVACGNAGLQIVDYSDTSNISIVGSYDGGGYAQEIMYADDLVYLTTEKNGLQVIDVSDVTNPIRIGSVDTEDALGIDMDEKYIYIADEDEGLIVIEKPQ